MNQGNVAITQDPQNGDVDWSNHTEAIERANVAFMVEIKNKGESWSSEVHSEHSNSELSFMIYEWISM